MFKKCGKNTQSITKNVQRLSLSGDLFYNVNRCREGGEEKYEDVQACIA